jgi:hypothetical protein
MKKVFALIVVTMLILVGCSTSEPADSDTSLAGRYVGYSWRGEAKGVTFEDADQYIETTLILDENGIITDAKMLFWVLKDGFWTTRQSGNAHVEIDFSVDPTPAVPGDSYRVGDSMFKVFTADMMSFYALAVDQDSTVAVALVEPVSRYQFEMKFTPGYDFSTLVSELTIGNGMVVPTVRTSGFGLVKPADWDSLADKNFLNLHHWSHVVNDVGVLAGITGDSSVQAFLEALGVEFVDNKPQAMAVDYGYFGLGGWAGNYNAIERSLIGQDATQMTSLVDWSIERYAGAVNASNIFGVDVQSGATKTVQNSVDGISGATVRISRESTSFQRALLDADIISEEDVIIGRF